MKSPFQFVRFHETWDGFSMVLEFSTSSESWFLIPCGKYVHIRIQDHTTPWIPAIVLGDSQYLRSKPGSARRDWKPQIIKLFTRPTKLQRQALCIQALQGDRVARKILQNLE